MKLPRTLRRSSSGGEAAGQAGVGPDAVEVAARRLRLDGGACATLVVTGYPREVGPGWLEPLLTYPGHITVALHIDPIPAAVAADRLRKQRARLESQRRQDVEHARLGDPEAEAAADDAAELASRLARGEDNLFRVGLHITVHARDATQLDAECQRVRSVAASMLLDARPATFRQLQGWISTAPFGIDLLDQRRTFATDALAAAFPFTSPDVTASSGDTTVLYGINATSNALVVWDRFTGQDNHNAVILARSGSGKSYLAKLEILRSLYRGIDVAVIDPEDEYARLAATVGGTHLHLADPATKLNPLDLGPQTDQAGEDALTKRALFTHTLIACLLDARLDPPTRAALDRGIVAAYAAAGITADARSWNRPAPLLADLAQALRDDGEAHAVQLADRLAPYITGTHRHLFDGPTSVRPEGHLVVFSTQGLDDELQPVATLLALDAIWRRVTNPAEWRRRLVLVDEAWLLMRHSDAARWLYRLAKSARKYWAGLTTVTQDADDLLSSDLGKAVIANAATQILMRQAPQAMAAIAESWGLSDGEQQWLLSARRGEGLLVAGPQRTGFQVVASAAEHKAATTDPAELLASDDDNATASGRVRS